MSSQLLFNIPKTNAAEEIKIIYSIFVIIQYVTNTHFVMSMRYAHDQGFSHLLYTKASDIVL